MIKNLSILINDRVIMEKILAKTFQNEKFFEQFVKGIIKEMTLRSFYDELMVIDILTLKFYIYRMKEPGDATFIAVTDDSISNTNFMREFNRCIGEIKKLIQMKIHLFLGEDYDFLSPIFRETYDKLSNIQPPKISVIGLNQVGKTSVIHRVFQKSMENLKPTMATDKIHGDLYGIPVILWDFSDEMINMWDRFLVGSEAVILVLDSTKANAVESKKLYKLLDRVIPHAEMLIVANKQDIPDRLSEEDLENLMEHPVLPVSCTEVSSVEIVRSNVGKLLEIIADELDYSQKSYIINRND